jgi:flavodoxin
LNKYLNSARERFSKISDKDYLIHPISEVDCEIFIELAQILKKAGLSEVIEIIKEYKGIKDAEIRDTLLQWNIDHPTLGITKLVNKIADKVSEDEEEDLFTKPAFFEIGDILINQYNLHGVIKYERFDDRQDDYVYGIIINPMPEGFNMKSVPIFANHKIEYSEESNRNEALKKLSEFLLECGIQTINLDQDEE